MVSTVYSINTPQHTCLSAQLLAGVDEIAAPGRRLKLAHAALVRMHAVLGLCFRVADRAHVDVATWRHRNHLHILIRAHDTLVGHYEIF